uniref:RNA-directed RNA polymerase n=1 Tax=Alphachrysovirus aspergilli TaxID=607716 RepID=A0A7I8CZM0_9VIRU|nr:RNA-dependent RNA polymerase [Alphachrysovirus aspergilli]
MTFGHTNNKSRPNNGERISMMATQFDIVRGGRISKQLSKLRSMRAYSQSGERFFGQNKWSREQYEHSMARYNELAAIRHNLYAVIMPAGCGKSYLAKKYGMVDVDELIARQEHDSYVDARGAIIVGKGDWKDHNNIWFSRLNETLDLLDYSMPVIIFVHTEETALEIGAKPIAFLRLTETAHEINIKHRDPQFRQWSRESLKRCRVSADVPNQMVFSSNRELEAFFLSILNASGIPVGGPLQFSEAIWNDSYAHDVPGWILRGERLGDPTVSINQLRLLFNEGKVPKECVDFYVRHSYVPTQFDFGVSMYEWSQALGQLPPCYNDHVDFDTESDMMKVFPPSSPKEVTRANVRVRQLVQTFDIFSHWDCYQIGAWHVGERQTFVANLLCCWKGITQFTGVAALVFPWFRVCQKDWANKLKTLHSLIRCSRFLMNTEISEKERQALMYMDLLVGRSEYTIDEMSEVRLRASDTYETKHLSYDPDRKMFTNRKYKEDFIVAVEEAYSRLRIKPKPVNVDSFMDFYQRRSTWLTKGSLVYNTLSPFMKKYYVQILDAVANTVLEIQGRHNKKSLFEVWEIGEVLQGVNETNFNITKTQIKYEVGNKDRTLLPGTLVHFIVFTYVLYLAEKQEQVGSVRLNAANEVDIRYVDRKMSEGIFHVLYDWANFNEQHSAWEMGLVIEKLNSVIVAPRDYSFFVEAIVAGMYNMGLHDREGRIHKIWQGLYSGWRGTTWVNTVLNFCYVHVALVNMERLYGVSVAIMLDHGGDDIDLGLSDPTYMPQFLETMDSMLFKANKWKQMFGVRSEFFRNTITDGSMYASPTRALASFVAGDWEGAGRATVRERVVSLLDQIAKLRRRGCSEELCQGLTISTISHWCKVRDGEEWLALPPVVIHGRVEDGGLGVPDRDNNVWVLKDKVPEVNEEWYKVVVPDYKASRDYVEVLARDLEKFCLVIERREELARKLAEDSYDIEKAVDHEQWRQLLDFQTEVVDKYEITPDVTDDVIFEGFVVYEVDEETEKKFDAAARYQEFVSYLTFNDKAVSKEELVSIMSDGQVSLEALEFQGDIYYARLVPEFISYRATVFCRDMINQGVLDTTTAGHVFRVICSMAKYVFGHQA